MSSVPTQLSILLKCPADKLRLKVIHDFYSDSCADMLNRYQERATDPNLLVENPDAKGFYKKIKEESLLKTEAPIETWESKNPGKKYRSHGSILEDSLYAQYHQEFGYGVYR